MRKLPLILVSFVALCALVGCGTSSSSPSGTIVVPPNPSGGNPAGFSNASLAAGKSYVYSVSGSNPTVNFAVVGTFVTDGHGNITSGTRDTVNDRGGQSLIEAVTGTYFVNADGRGQMVLNGPSAGQAIYRFVLHSPTAQQPSQVGELFQDGATATSVIIDALGSIQQVSGAPAAPAGPYIVRLDGEDLSLNLYGAVGGITFTGNTITGLIDENDNGTFNQQLALSNGNFSGYTNGRATATYTTPNATHNFIAYYVSPARLELVSTDRNFFLHGNADQQTSFAPTNAAFTGDQVFSLSGYDNSPGPRAQIGRMTLNGDGTLSNAIEDYVNVINVYPGGSLTANSSYAVGANGRWTANLIDVTAPSSTGLVGWQVSFGPLPQDQKSLVLTTNSTVLETGVLLGQNLGLNDASVTGNYAETLSGFDVGAQSYVELTGNLCTSSALCANPTASGSLSGTYDAQTDASGLSLDTFTSGTYTIDPILGRSTAANLENTSVAMYTVDADTILFVSSEQGLIYQGDLVTQQ